MVIPAPAEPLIRLFSVPLLEGSLDVNAITSIRRSYSSREPARLSIAKLATVAVVPIRIAGEPILHNPTRLVPIGADGPLPGGLGSVISDLFDTLAASGGVGLSANQIGADLRLFVYDCPEVRGELPRHRGCVINPVLQTSPSRHALPDPDADLEGCLSAPGEKFPVSRANWARVTGLDEEGAPVTVEGTGLIARMLQHETGHLDGELYIDRLVAPYVESAAKAFSNHGWGVPGLAWTPGLDANPFDE
jgi:peptide deformylase